MWKRHALVAMVAVAVLTTLGSSSTLAQQEQRDRLPVPRSSPPGRDDAAAYLEARIAALHAGLQLSAEQERIWSPFEQAYRELASLRTVHARPVGDDAGVRDPVARMEGRAEALIRWGTVLKRLAEASAPLWRSFDDGQKRRFMVLSRAANLQFGYGWQQRDDFQSGGRYDDPAGSDTFPGLGSGPWGITPDSPMERNDDHHGYDALPPRWGPAGPSHRDGGRYDDRSGVGRMGPGGPSGGPFSRDKEDQDGSNREDRRWAPGNAERRFGGEPGREQSRAQFRWWQGPPKLGPPPAWREGHEPIRPGGGFRAPPADERGGHGDPDDERL